MFVAGVHLPWPLPAAGATFLWASALMRIVCKAALLMALFSFLAGCDRIEAWLAPKADLWERWEIHDPAAAGQIDHAPWQRLLKAYLVPGKDGINRMAYGKVTEAHRRALQAYLARLTALPVSHYRRAEQLAYWVNLYNALTVELVLSHYPVQSILDIKISPGLLGYGPWDKKLTEVEGQQLSLNDIEHRILRPIWRDPRIHYVVNCASLGCPNLPLTALTAENAGTLLDAGAMDYVNHARGARVEGGKLRVSKIYNWFSADFGANHGEIIAHLKRYARPPLAGALNGVEKITGYEYDWTLNEAAGP